VVSIGFQVMFLTSTGLYMSDWWLPFASIAILFGAGRVFSLDYYVLPYLKSWWKNRKIVRKWYLYHD
jgi:NADH dehydrogenase